MLIGLSTFNDLQQLRLSYNEKYPDFVVYSDDRMVVVSL